MTATSTEIEVVDLTEHAQEMQPCCELGVYPVGCENVAEWIMFRKCCGVPALACDPCKGHRTDVERFQAGMCGSCGYVIMGDLHYFRIERL